MPLTLQAIAPHIPAHQRICLALSGGVDSMVLLHLLANLRTSHPFTLSAIHVHHGLNPDADQWLDFCREACARLSVPFAAERVCVRPKGQGIEAAARAADSRITNSEGAHIQTGHYQYVYGNSHGFMQHQRSSRHSLSCSVVAGSGSGMQRDYWYDLARSSADLDTPEHIGQTAARRAVQRLGAKSLPTGSYPVLFDATVSGSLIGHLAGALSGGALYRQTSFLQDSIGLQILPAALSLREEPHLPKALASTAFDAEGVATRPRFVIENGIIQGYFLSSYSARKLGLPTTANAGGAHNLILSHTHPSQADLLREMGSGLLVTELMGQGVNTLTGDYSRGAAGFWVENGQIAYPVQEITIASRLQDMLPNIAGAANDALKRSAHKTGSLLLEQMTVAGH